jgi:hypothetical protein
LLRLKDGSSLYATGIRNITLREVITQPFEMVNAFCWRMRRQPTFHVMTESEARLYADTT